ncbi:hypothetical protein EV659_109115 [Rhodothalassium salexigens DSM 2132]|uniref:Uncharacterized protein n=1 Tax=Rhodothalassium salexigens DSM 2132 TaxID=1188247 RepID=A0A4R2PC13_RHOSA|nr:hypothetical protein [Rhodothalassium salexigens]MBB4212227.1 hypothetical protein [Rhodothalassium salexigens DSM 2132]TCP32622.1 hypothetical protein EV659_109115 [Rhodothalassium salexigens DSM 2132]
MTNAPLRERLAALTANRDSAFWQLVAAQNAPTAELIELPPREAAADRIALREAA